MAASALPNTSLTTLEFVRRTAGMSRPELAEGSVVSVATDPGAERFGRYVATKHPPVASPTRYTTCWARWSHNRYMSYNGVVMQCLVCSASTRVLDSRSVEDGFAVRRRRECEHCGERCTTYERVDAQATAVERVVIDFIRRLDRPAEKAITT